MSLVFLIGSCIYKAGNRQSDINYLWKSSVSPYYIKKYMLNIDSFYVNREIVTSEIINYPESFIPVTDSVMSLKYVIEFNNMDSLNSVSQNYLTLASVYDFKKGKWITLRDSLTNNELNKFKHFFEDSIMAKTVKLFKNNVPDSLLFIGVPDTIAISTLH